MAAILWQRGSTLDPDQPRSAPISCDPDRRKKVAAKSEQEEGSKSKDEGCLQDTTAPWQGAPPHHGRGAGHTRAMIMGRGTGRRHGTHSLWPWAAHSMPPMAVTHGKQ